MFGSEKKYYEKKRIKRLAYALLGEVHVPGMLRAWHVMRKVARLDPGRGPVKFFDAGCGRGDLVVHFSKKHPDWKVSGIEYDRERYETALEMKKRLGLANLTLRHGDLLQSSPLEDGADIMTCCDVLEHIENDEKAIKGLYMGLNPGGSLILTFPSIPQRKHLKLVEWRERRIGFKNSDYGHVRDGYSIEGISEKLRAAGFTDISCEYTYGFWGTLSFDLFFVLGDNRPHPAVFLLAFPFLMAAAGLDLLFPIKKGSGLLVVAKKP